MEEKDEGIIQERKTKEDGASLEYENETATEEKNTQMRVQITPESQEVQENEEERTSTPNREIQRSFMPTPAATPFLQTGSADNETMTRSSSLSSSLSSSFSSSSSSPSVVSLSSELPISSGDSTCQSATDPTSTTASSNLSSPPLSSNPKKFAFISHSPSTFPTKIPEIDNTQLVRKRRRRTNAEALEVLESHFDQCSKPPKRLREEIARQAQMTERSVQIWFQNKRRLQRINTGGKDEGSSLSITGAKANDSNCTTPTAAGLLEKPNYANFRYWTGSPVTKMKKAQQKIGDAVDWDKENIPPSRQSTRSMRSLSEVNNNNHINHSNNLYNNGKYGPTIARKFQSIPETRIRLTMSTDGKAVIEQNSLRKATTHVSHPNSTLGQVNYSAASQQSAPPLASRNPFKTMTSLNLQRTASTSASSGDNSITSLPTTAHAALKRLRQQQQQQSNKRDSEAILNLLALKSGVWN